MKYGDMEHSKKCGIYRAKMYWNKYVNTWYCHGCMYEEKIIRL